MSEPNQLEKIPAEFAGRWAVISATTPEGDQIGGGEILDYWDWTPSTIVSSEWDLTVGSVVADIEEDQDMHLVNFTNNLQFAVIRTKQEPDVILVVQYGNGEEMMRCLLTQNV